MASINWVKDYGVPAAVGLGELGLKAWDRSRLQKDVTAIEYEPLFPYALAIAGTGARMFNALPKHDEMIKMAVAASLPRVITGIYDWATTAAGASKGYMLAPSTPKPAVTPAKAPAKAPVKVKAIADEEYSGYRSF